MKLERAPSHSLFVFDEQLNVVQIGDASSTSLSSSVAALEYLSTDLRKPSLIEGRGHPCRRVTFAMEKNQEYEPQHCKEDLKGCSYTRKDFKKFRMQSADIVHEELPLAFEQVLLETYQYCCEADVGDDEFSILDDSERRKVKEGFELSLSSRWFGLEKHTLRAVARNRELQRQAVVDTVLDLQLDDCLEEEISYEVQRISITSKLFARILAQAQYEAMKSEDDILAEIFAEYSSDDDDSVPEAAPEEFEMVELEAPPRKPVSRAPRPFIV